MKPLLTFLALGVFSLAPFTHAQEIDPNDAEPAPVCTVARDEQWISPAGVLHVLDRAGSQVLRWSLGTRARLTPVTLASGGAAFAYVPARDSLAVLRTNPNRLATRPLTAGTPERLLAFLPSGEPCGLGATDQHVIACVRNAAVVTYLVYPTVGRPPFSPLDSLDGIGPPLRVPAADPNDPNAAVPPLLPSWDGMAWDGETRTLFATRTQARFLGALAVTVAEDGRLGEPTFVEPAAGGDVLRAIETLSVLPDKRLLAPDGVILSTDPELAIDVAPNQSLGDTFAIGTDVLTMGDAVTRGCALTTQDGELAAEARIATGPVRTAFWNGRAFVLIGSGATATLRGLRAGSGDLDGDFSPDAKDVFPLEAVTRRDWDHDGIADGEDAAPLDPNDWLDSDGDKVADNADAFPEDPSESKDTDGDGVGDRTDAFPLDPDRSADIDGDGADDESEPDITRYDPLEQSDLDENGVGDIADAEPRLGRLIAAFELKVRRGVGLHRFVSSGATSEQLFIFYDNGRFELCELGERFRDCAVSGFYERKGRGGNRLLLRFDVRTLSQMERDFAFEASALVSLVTPDPRESDPLFFVPRKVISSGAATVSKNGVTLGISARFAYKRAKRGDPGYEGGILYRAKGPAILSLPPL